MAIKGNAGVPKLVKGRDLKSLGFGLTGSTPVPGTILSISSTECRKQRIAVWTNNPQILQSVVIVDAIDVIQY